MKPSVALLVCLGLVAVATLVKQPLSDIAQHEKELIRETVHAGVETRAHLAGLMTAFVEDPSLARHLEWNLEHSTRQFLEGQVREGELDALRIYGPDCAVRAETKAPAPLPLACPQTPEQSSFFWTSREGASALALVRPITVKNETYLVYGEVWLNERWRMSHPRLRHLLNRLDARLVPEDKVEKSEVLWRDMPAPSPAVLASDNLWLTLLPIAPDKLNAWLDDFILVWLTGSVVLFLLMLLSQERRVAGNRKVERGFVKWLAEQAKGRGVALAGRAEDTLAEAQKLVGGILDRTEENERRADEEARALRQRIQTLEKEVLRLERQEHEYIRLDSLASQLQLVGPALVHEAARIKSQLEDVLDAIKAGLHRPAEELAGMSFTWQRGLMEQSPRRFLRGLSETMTAEGQSVLDHDLDLFHTQSQRVAQVSVNLGLLTARAVHRLERVREQAEHLFTLIAAEPDYRIETFGELFARVERLVALLPDLPRLKWNRRAEAAHPIPRVAIPDQVWVCVLFHATLALATSLIDEDEIDVQVFTRERNGQRYWILSSAQAGPRRTFSPEGERHRHLARRLLSGQAVELLELPNPNGLPPLAVAYAEEADGMRRSEHVAFRGMDQT